MLFPVPTARRCARNCLASRPAMSGIRQVIRTPSIPRSPVRDHDWGVGPASWSSNAPDGRFRSTRQPFTVPGLIVAARTEKGKGPRASGALECCHQRVTPTSHDPADPVVYLRCPGYPWARSPVTLGHKEARRREPRTSVRYQRQTPAPSAKSDVGVRILCDLTAIDRVLARPESRRSPGRPSLSRLDGSSPPAWPATRPAGATSAGSFAGRGRPVRERRQAVGQPSCQCGRPVTPIARRGPGPARRPAATPAPVTGSAGRRAPGRASNGRGRVPAVTLNAAST